MSHGPTISRIAEDRLPDAVGASRLADRGLLAAVGVTAAFYVACWVLLCWMHPEPIGDERIHFNIAVRLASGDASAASGLPMFPAYHWVAGFVAHAFGDSLAAARGVSVFFAVIVAGAAALAALRGGCGSAARLPTALAIAMNPIAVPFAVLAYTDIPTLAAVLAALALHAHSRRLLAQFALGGATLLRFTSAALLPLLAVQDWLRARADDDEPAGSAIGGRMRLLLPYLGGGLLIAGVLAFTVGKPDALSSDNRAAVNRAQLYLFAITVGVIWLPLWIEELARAWRERVAPNMMRASRVAAFIGATGSIALLYDNPHGWNGNLEYLRNYLLMGMLESSLLLSGACLFIMTTLVAICLQARRATTERQRTRLLLAWGFALLFVAPHWLVEPRYYLAPIAVLHLAMPYSPAQAWRVAAWNIALAGVAAALLLRNGANGGVW